MLRKAKFASLVALRLPIGNCLGLLQLFDLLEECQFDVHHRDKALIVRARHELQRLKLIDTRERQRLSSFIDLSDQVVNLLYVLFRLGLLGQAQEADQALSLVLEARQPELITLVLSFASFLQLACGVLIRNGQRGLGKADRVRTDV